MSGERFGRIGRISLGYSYVTRKILRFFFFFFFSFQGGGGRLSGRKKKKGKIERRQWMWRSQRRTAGNSPSTMKRIKYSSTTHTKKEACKLVTFFIIDLLPFLLLVRYPPLYFYFAIFVLLICSMSYRASLSLNEKTRARFKKIINKTSVFHIQLTRLNERGLWLTA